MPPTPLEVKTIVSAPFAENSYIAYLQGAQEAVVVDPGMDPGAIFESLDAERLTPAALLVTHGHSDHIAGLGAMKGRWPDCPIVIGRLEAPKLADPWQNLSAAYGMSLVCPPADVLLDDGEQYTAAGLEFETRLIPGHSSGHVVFVCRQFEPPVVFGGDVLFAGGIGRTDFPDGDFRSLADGIWRHLFCLPPATRVFPGHGEPTTIADELRDNQWVGQSSKYGRQRRG